MMNTKINLNDKEQNNQIELTSEENIQIRKIREIVSR